MDQRQKRRAAMLERWLLKEYPLKKIEVELGKFYGYNPTISELELYELAYETLNEIKELKGLETLPEKKRNKIIRRKR